MKNVFFILNILKCPAAILSKAIPSLTRVWYKMTKYFGQPLTMYKRLNGTMKTPSEITKTGYSGLSLQ